jgi:hypothetical protein
MMDALPNIASARIAQKEFLWRTSSAVFWQGFPEESRGLFSSLGLIVWKRASLPRALKQQR